MPSHIVVTVLRALSVCSFPCCGGVGCRGAECSFPCCVWVGCRGARCVALAHSRPVAVASSALVSLARLSRPLLALAPLADPAPPFHDHPAISFSGTTGDGASPPHRRRARAPAPLRRATTAHGRVPLAGRPTISLARGRRGAAWGLDGRRHDGDDLALGWEVGPTAKRERGGGARVPRTARSLRARRGLPPTPHSRAPRGRRHRRHRERRPRRAHARDVVLAPLQVCSRARVLVDRDGPAAEEET